MQPNQKVGLGCGSLVLIALIVTMCSGGGNLSSSQDIKDLKVEIRVLKHAIDEQRSDIEKLQKTIESQNNLANPRHQQEAPN